MSAADRRAPSDEKGARSRGWVKGMGVIAAALSLATLASTTVASGQCQDQEDQKYVASDGLAGDQFAKAISVSGNIAVVGVPETDDTDTNTGSAYVFRFTGSTWVEEQELHASDPGLHDKMGSVVATDGTVIVVGAFTDDNVGFDSGSVYVFRHDGTSWVEEQKLTASDEAANDRFGRSAAIDGDVIVVGATHNDDRGSDSGSAYVFRYSGALWVQEQKLLASNGSSSDYFGISVDVHGDVIAVGADNADGLAFQSGSAYVFRYTGTEWREEQEIYSPLSQRSDGYGGAIAVEGDVVAVGAGQNSGGGSRSGAIYVHRYDGTTWIEEQRLLASDSADNDGLGTVDLAGDWILGGASGADLVSTDQGAGYLFHHNGYRWVQTMKFWASDGATGDGLGGTVALNGRSVWLGSYRADTLAGNDVGAMYEFDHLGLGLEANNLSPDVGDLVVFGACGGRAFGPAYLYLLDLSGVPSFVRVASGSFDYSQGRWETGAVIPAGLTGLTATFLAIGSNGPGSLGLSNNVTLTFQ